MKKAFTLISISCLLLLLIACNSTSSTTIKNTDVEQQQMTTKPQSTNEPSRNIAESKTEDGQVKESDTTDLYELVYVKDTEHFSINYSEMDTACIDEVAEALETNYSRIADTLKQEITDIITVNIYSDLHQLRSALGAPDSAEWIRGGYGHGKILMASPLNPPPGSTYDNVVNAAIHEYVHLMINQIYAVTPKWLNEGIACYEAKDNDENFIKDIVRTGISTDNIPSIKDLDTGYDYQSFADLGGYGYSYTIIEFMEKEFSYDNILTFISSPDDFETAFGLTEEEFQNKWIEYLKENYN